MITNPDKGLIKLAQQMCCKLQKCYASPLNTFEICGKFTWQCYSTNKYNSCTIYLVFELVPIMQYLAYLVNTIGTGKYTSVFGESKMVVVWFI